MTSLTDCKNLPKHVAIVMDGNGRWAKQRGQARHHGHRAGVESVRCAVNFCANKGIQTLTLFAFSSENWRRPTLEVTLLLDLFATTLQRETNKFAENNIRLRIIGDTLAFPKKLQQRIKEAENKTQHNTALTLQIAANYGGRWDIVQTAKQLAKEVCMGTLALEDINEKNFAQATSFTNQITDPDLFIRTGGELRLSNFLLWHSAYTELYFTDTLWPDFDAESFEKALADYAKRQRRFGKTGHQIREAHESNR